MTAWKRSRDVGIRAPFVESGAFISRLLKMDAGVVAGSLLPRLSFNR